MNRQEISIKEKELVIARLGTASPDLHFSDGENMKSYSRDDMVKLIREDNKVGLEFIRTELEFLRALKSGEFMQKITNAS